MVEVQAAAAVALIVIVVALGAGRFLRRRDSALGWSITFLGHAVARLAAAAGLAAVAVVLGRDGGALRVAGAVFFALMALLSLGFTMVLAWAAVRSPPQERKG